MINLLNPDELKQLRAARLNIKLRRFSIATLLTILVVGAIYTVGYMFARQEFSSAEAHNTAAQKDLAQYDDVKQKAAAYRSNLDVAKKILGNEIVFSNFITEVAKILPENTVLSDLSLTTKQTAVTAQRKAGSTQLKARAKGYADVLTLKTKLEESDIFSDVNIASTSVSNSSKAVGIEAEYPYQVTFNLVIDDLKGATK